MPRIVHGRNTRAATMIRALDRISRQRALSEAESLMLERLIREEEKCTACQS